MGEGKRKKESFRPLFWLKSKASAGLIIVGVSIFIIALIDFVNNPTTSLLDAIDPARTKGHTGAALKIVEFLDPQCQECAMAHSILRKFMNDYPDGVYLTVKYFPLGQLNSTISAKYVECAARQDKFWKYLGALFDYQPDWRTQNEVEPFLQKYAQQLGINVNELVDCVEQEDVKNVVLNERLLGESHFVHATPTFFINDKMHVGVEELLDVLSEHFEVDREDLIYQTMYRY